MNDKELIESVKDARQRAFDLVGDLTDEQLMGPQLSVVNPGLWEMGHHAWFQSRWALRHAGGQLPILAGEDELYDSMEIAHDSRWDLPLPSREATLAYMRDVRDRVLALLENNPSDELRYHAFYSTLHEDMHTEAYTYTRQTHGFPPPRFSSQAVAIPTAAGGGPCTGDVEIPGGTFRLGAEMDEPFVFDNEKWAHPVELNAFNIARAAVTQEEFAVFIDAGGYRDRQLWTADGWQWVQSEGADGHVYWRRDAGRWQRRRFDVWVDLEPHKAVIHVNWFEADAYCRWAGRRLPTEAEWQAAATALPTGDGQFSKNKLRFPWGDAPSPTPEHANLDWRGMGTIDVGALPAGDSPWGCRQMIGNAWEWTSSDFLPFPGFVVDAYKDYSEPWFGTRKVMLGGCWATRSRLIRAGYRNFQTPDRRDVLTGFRTCAQ
jgi:iron(II)-dependent oxidoreductase